MRRDRGVKKRHGETHGGDGREGGFVHQLTGASRKDRAFRPVHPEA
jgi:hypothetical protein